MKIKKLVYYFGFVILLWFFILFFTRETILDYQIDRIKNEAIYLRIDSALNDTLSNWISAKVRLAQPYKKNKWLLDGIVFNEDKKRFIGCLLSIDSDASVRLDMAQVFGGEIDKKQNITFYFSGIFPTVYFDRDVLKTNGKQYSFDQLSKLARRELSRGGILNYCNWKVNNDYVNGWFENEAELKKRYREFLNDKEEDL